MRVTYSPISGKNASNRSAIASRSSERLPSVSGSAKFCCYSTSPVKRAPVGQGEPVSSFLRADRLSSGTVRHYLFTAVRSEALNTIRHQQVVKEKEEEFSRIFTELKNETPDSENFDTKALRKEIERAVDQLLPRCQQIFMLNRRSRLTYEEIADFMDISIDTVGTQMRRALKSLWNHLSDYVPLLVAGELSMMVYQTLLTLLLMLWPTFG